MSSSTSSLRSLSPAGRPRRHNSASIASAKAARGAAFASAILSALCAGSITVFSLYGHIFQERLHYSQFQVNGVAIAASIASYLPVPVFGYFCDRAGPAPLSAVAAVLFGSGYAVAAFVYRQADGQELSGGNGSSPAHRESSLDTYYLMVAAFVTIGAGTCSMYLSAVATCAKNFGRGRHRGLALAAPIAAFGLSGMWQSQLGSRVLYERLPPLPDSGPDAPPRRGDVDVFAFFLFLSVLLSVVGVVGAFLLRVVDEEDLIDEAVEELERSGLLDGSALFSPSAAGPGAEDDILGRSTRFGPGASGSGSGNGRSYGTMDRTDPFRQHTDDEEEDEEEEDVRHRNRSRLRFRRPSHEDDALAHRLLDPSKDDATTEGDCEAAVQARLARQKKQWVLNAETHRFLSDHTMWLFALGFFFMIGPGEAFINNMGTVLRSLQPPPPADAWLARVWIAGAPTSAATHVSIVGLTSTVARLLTGSLTDWLAPRPQTQHLQGGRDLPSSSQPVSVSEWSDSTDARSSSRSSSSIRSHSGADFSVSRVAFLLAFALLLSAGLAVLASGLVQGHGERFWIVSGLIGAGYGAVFSLTPIIITVIWGVENFATNWGIVAMFPALGATLWGLVYSAVYQAGVPANTGSDGGGAADDSGNICYGTKCYAPTFWAMAVSVWVACGCVVLAWKGRGGWSKRGIVI